MQYVVSTAGYFFRLPYHTAYIYVYSFYPVINVIRSSGNAICEDVGAKLSANGIQANAGLVVSNFPRQWALLGIKKISQHGPASGQVSLMVHAKCQKKSNHALACFRGNPIINLEKNSN